MPNLIATYNKVARGYQKTNANNFWDEEFVLFKKLMPGKKVIDIGCGTGRDARVFLKHKFDYTGIDASRGMLAVARKQAKRGRFFQMSFYDLKFPKENFDGFWASASLLHVPKRKMPSVLRGIYKIIKPGGAGFISLKEKKILDEEVIREDKYGAKIARFFSFWKAAELKKILEKNGFKVVKVTKDRSHSANIWLCFFVQKV